MTRNPTWGPDAFNSEMLELARVAAALSQTELAGQVGVAQNTLSRWESGIRIPTQVEVDRLASALGRPSSFFVRSERPIAVDSAFMFRKRARAPVSVIRQLHARINIARLAVIRLLRQIEDWRVHVHKMPIDQFDSAAEVAKRLRAAWNVAPGPIRDLVGMVEAAGAVVFSFDFGCADIDAVGVLPWGSPPLMFINAAAPTDRVRFSMAHELGHLVMHEVPSDTMESEANEFAGEFLVPGNSARSELQQLSTKTVWGLKRRWRVSAQCLVRRARDCRVMPEDRYRSIMSYFSKRGWRKQEPYPIDGEAPSTVNQIVSTFRQQLGYSVNELQELMGVTTHELDIMFNVRPSTPKLRVISAESIRRPR